MNKIYPFWLKMFLVFLLGSTTILVIIVGVYIYSYTTDITSNALSYSQDILNSTSLNVDNYLLRYINTIDMQNISQFYNIVEIKQELTEKSLYKWKIASVLQHLSDSVGSIDGVAFMDNEGEFISVGRVDNDEFHDIIQQNREQMDIANGMDIWSFHKSANRGNNILLLKKLRYIDSIYKVSDIGYIVLAINEDTFYKKCIVLESQSNEIVLTNDKNLVVSSTSKDFIGVNFDDLFSKAGLYFKDSKNTTYGILKEKSKLLNIEVKYLINITHNEQNIYNKITFVILIILIFVAILFALFLVIYKNTNKPITTLSNYMKEVGNGNYDVRIDYTANDEIGFLCESFNNMTKELHIQINENLHMQLRMKDAMIMALESQTNPHFIYNTLELIRMMSLLGESDDIEMVALCLGNIMRYNLNKKKEVTIREELESVENYFKILKIRHMEKFNYYIDIPDEIKDYHILKFVLQPFIENSLKHAMIGNESLEISIEAKVVKHEVALVIMDNGKGMTPDELKKLCEYVECEGYEKEHIGIKNVHWRLKLHYGETYGVQIYSKEGEYTKILIHIPLNGDV